METQFKDVAHLYLGCKVQYIGVVNGKDIAKYVKEYDELNGKEIMPNFKPDFNPPEENHGFKIGHLKRINWNKHSGNVYEIGTFQHGLKKYYTNSLIDVSPVLYPLSAMTVPIMKAWYNSIKEYDNHPEVQLGEDDFKLATYEVQNHGMDAFDMRYNKTLVPHLIAFLLSQYFDLFGLIESGQAIDATTI